MQPQNLELPFFAYGFLKPSEIAYPRIEPYVEADAPLAHVTGTLWLRDGLPLLDVGRPRYPVPGYLLRFRPDEAYSAYRAIAGLEPANMYEWGVTPVHVDQGEVRANVLIGVAPAEGGSEELRYAQEWSSAGDPLFNEALDEIRKISLVSQEGQSAPDELVRLFFHKQMAYLLLWSVIERYASLRYRMTGRSATKRVLRLADEDAFREGLRRSVRRKDSLHQADRSREPLTLDRNEPEESLKYYYRVRGNIVHRGKAALQDLKIIDYSLSELLQIFEHVLAVTVKQAATKQSPRRERQFELPI